MLTVVNGELMVEEKGTYSVEKFLMARRFMYWQVYLHKTGIVAEQLLIRILKRGKELLKNGVSLECTKALHFFMTHKISKENFDTHVLESFAKLDDVDILAAIKSWQNHDDFVLSRLCQMVLHRRLLKIKLKKKPINQSVLSRELEHFKTEKGITEEEARYFVFEGQIENVAYHAEKQNINIIRKSGKITDVAKASDHLNLTALSKKVTKYYMCYPKNLM